MDFVFIFGVIGTLLLLFAFIMNQIHRWKNDYLIYDLVNFIGSVFLVIYAIILPSFPLLILFLVWASMSVYDVFTDWDRNRKRERKDFFDKWLK